MDRETQVLFNELTFEEIVKLFSGHELDDEYTGNVPEIKIKAQELRKLILDYALERDQIDESDSQLHLFLSMICDLTASTLHQQPPLSAEHVLELVSTLEPNLFETLVKKLAQDSVPTSHLKHFLFESVEEKLVLLSYVRDLYGLLNGALSFKTFKHRYLVTCPKYEIDTFVMKFGRFFM